MEVPEKTPQQVDPIRRFESAGEALAMAIEFEMRTRGNVDLIALRGEVVMLRLGFRTLVELLAKHGHIQLTEWDKAYTAAIERETERVKSRAIRGQIAGAVDVGINGGRKS